MSSNKTTDLEKFCPECGTSLNGEEKCIECGWMKPKPSSKTDESSLNSNQTDDSKSPSFQVKLKRSLHSSKFSLKNLLDPALISQIVVILLIVGYVGLFFDLISLFFALINNSIFLIRSIITKAFQFRFLFWELGSLVGLSAGIYLFLQPFLKNLVSKLHQESLEGYFRFIKISSFEVPIMFVITGVLQILSIPRFNFSLIFLIIASLLVTTQQSSNKELKLSKIQNEANYFKITNFFAYLAVILLIFQIITNGYSIVENIFYQLIGQGLGTTWANLIWDIIYLVVVSTLLFFYFIPYILKPLQVKDWQFIKNQKITIKKLWIPIPFLFLVILYIIDYDIGWYFILMIVVLAMIYYKDEIKNKIKN